MKYTVPLILAFFLCHICHAQHISDFTSLEAIGQDTNFNLPSTHTFQVLIEQGDDLHKGGELPGKVDFTGYVPRNGSSKYGYLSINSEAVPGAVSILDIEFNDVLGSWLIDYSAAVDFSLDFPTIANCSGTVTPWNTIITCEEYTSIDLEADPDYGFDKDINGDGYHDLGWAIEIDPATKMIINQTGGRDDKDKLWAMGNFKHENAVISTDHRTVYQGADATYKNVATREGDGYLFKFVASRAEDLSEGDLYVYKGDKVSTHEWIKLANSTKDEQNTTIAQCKSHEATAFGGIEDVEISPIDGFIYFAVKKEYVGDISRKGVIYRFKDSSSGISDFEIYAGGNSVYDGVRWGEGNDNLVFDDLGNLWVAQDGSFIRNDENYIWVIENGHTESSPKVRIFARTPEGSEPTGLTFSPDYRYIFMSIQHPYESNSVSNQLDALDNSVSFDKDITIVIARDEHLGKDLTLDNQDIMISQYYHDEASDSKWIEIKNISGEDIALGTYFIDLYDNGDLVDIASSEPKASESIPAMMKDEVLLYKNRQSPAAPLATHLGDADQIVSSIADFDGNDVILITTTPGTRKYLNRKDIIGNITPSQWGQNTSLIRGDNSSELPERDFDSNNWIELDPLQEVSQADKLKNIALGTHVIGPAIWNGASWDNDSPSDRTRNTEIKGNYVVGQEDFAAYDLNIDKDASLKFEDDTKGSNKNLIVYRNLTIDTEGSLIIGDTESLIIKDADAMVTGIIEKIEYSSDRNDPHDITYWSSPVQDEQIENVFLDVDPERIFHFDQTRHLTNDPDDPTYWDVWVNQSVGPMNVAKGYAVEGIKGSADKHLLSFKGQPNFGIIESETLDYEDDGSTDNDYNLIGNPYPAAIDIDLFLMANTVTNNVIDGTVYLWTHATALVNGAYGNDYITYNYLGPTNTDVSPNIGSAQGFFIRAIKSDKVVFKPSMILEGANNQFFKGVKQKNDIDKNRLWINLKGSNGSLKQILIGFDENASKDMDLGYDALYLKGSQPIDFYSFLSDSDVRLAIQGREPFHDDMVIELGVESSIEGIELQFEIDKIEGEFEEHEVMLNDKELGVLHDLNTAPYTFKYNAEGNFNERFSLVFNSAILNVDELQTDQKIIMYMNDGKLMIDSPLHMQQIKLYDIQGRLLQVYKPNSSNAELNIDHISKVNFFMVQIVNEKGNTLTRKMLRY